MKKSLLLALGLVIVLSSSARRNNGNNSGKTDEIKQVAASCIAPSSTNELNINNVRALIQSGGDMWWDLQQSPKYEIPKNSGQTSLFAGALWIGGKDVSNNLKVAAQTFRNNGVDFWTGPLRNDNTASIDAATCTKYDKHFGSTRKEVATFSAWYQAGEFDKIFGTSTQQENFPGYQIPQFIIDWPWQEYGDYLAPFFDNNNDGRYDPSDGDYPGYDLSGSTDCKTDRLLNLYGDQNLWWVFNDNGNIHGETGADAIGMEIRAQAFAFATNDEVNNMTFYNYELINKSTFTLTDAYFGQWVDPDLGNPQDDFVGCDVMRGLGYCYNGDENDEDNAGAIGYGQNPPAIGVDFFQGPYQDNDGFDNHVGIKPGEALNGVGYDDDIIDNERFGMRRFVYYSNGDPQRGDPRTAAEYYNYLKGFWNDAGAGTKMVYGGTGHPIGCPGENSTVGFECIPSDFMFPGDSDPLHWGTGGQPTANGWTELNSGNTPGDRRFLQSAGPFTLAPGAKNNITVGVAWARATSGGVFASVEALLKADDKTQALFDNCFQLLEGPDAPKLTIQELDQEIILYIENCATSNNANEDFAQIDPSLTAPDSVLINSQNIVVQDTIGIKDSIQYYDANGNPFWHYEYDIQNRIVVLEEYKQLTEEEKTDYATFRFQGYQIYQVKSNSVSATDLGDPEKARLIAQCDIQDGIDRIINYEFDEDMQASVPKVMVEGADEGIFHSLKVLDDQFATGDRRLVNHKTYYFMAIAYAYNKSPYNIFDPGNAHLGGQQLPYLPSRKSCTGGQIVSYPCIPHKISMESAGTIARAKYGDELPLIRMAGRGSGGRFLELTQESIDNIMDGEEDQTGTGAWRAIHPEYKAGSGPISVKVVDPLNIPAGFFEFHLQENDSLKNVEYNEANWVLYYFGDTITKEYHSNQTIDIANEQLILDVGLSISVEQHPEIQEFIQYKEESVLGDFCQDGIENAEYVKGFLDAKMTFEDAQAPWLTGVADGEGAEPTNWIRSGLSQDENTELWDDSYVGCNQPTPNGNELIKQFIDPESIYESILGGTWAPFRMCAVGPHGPVPGGVSSIAPNVIDNYTLMKNTNSLKYLQNVDVIFTDDKSKWTRCPVLEMQGDYSLSEGQVQKGALRYSPSLDQNGQPFDTTGLNIKDLSEIPVSDNPNAPNFIGGYGMSWFPGYAINVETGERLNMAFGEDSWMQGQNGRDMIWNPTYDITKGPFDNARLGGKHYIFVFRNNVVEDFPNVTRSEFKPLGEGDFARVGTHVTIASRQMPSYDYGSFMFSKLQSAAITDQISRTEAVKKFNLELTDVYRAAMWVSLPLLREGHSLKSMTDGIIPNQTTVNLRVNSPFRGYPTGRSFDVGTVLEEDWYFVNRGPVKYGDHIYQRGEYFWANGAEELLDGSNGNTDVQDLKANVLQSINAGRPTYFFNTHDISTLKADRNTLVDALNCIGVVPNPYYAYSQYEESKLDHEIKIINLPDEAHIKIFTASGILVRELVKSDPNKTSISWDLKNSANIDVSSGLYLVHVNVPGIGQRVLKWYGMMRPIDLDNF